MAAAAVQQTHLPPSFQSQGSEDPLRDSASQTRAGTQDQVLWQAAAELQVEVSRAVPCPRFSPGQVPADEAALGAAATHLQSRERRTRSPSPWSHPGRQGRRIAGSSTTYKIRWGN